LNEEMKVEDLATKKPESLRGIVLCKLLAIRTRSSQKKANLVGFIHGF
tara:strand:- start:593 stop:736 length:144 start_codon:yes stop_codon:yes gene_type:complete